MTAPQATTKKTENLHTPTRRKPPHRFEVRDNIPAPGTDEGAYFHYTPAEAAKWLPFEVHKLLKLANGKEVPHVNNGSRIWFSGMNIRAISEQFTVQPFVKNAA